MMIEHKDIIVFSDDWGRHPSSCQHLVSQLLPYNRVVWVNTIGMRSPKITLYDMKRCCEIMNGWFKSNKSQERCLLPQNLTVVTPIIIPYNGSTIIRKFNRLSVGQKIRLIMEKQGMVDPLVITTFPCTCDFVGEFDESMHVYYCVDDFVNWPGVDLSLIRSMEDDLIEKVDLVFGTAEALCEAKERNGKRPVLLTHGVDFEHFHDAINDFDRPDEFQNLSSPIIGFFGALSAWLDLDLIVEMASARPDWSFVLIGPIDSDISALQGAGNIHLLGRIPYAILPRYAVFFDVAIIPFQVNDLTKSVNPLKLLEYLSLGIPVVSSFMPEVNKYTEYVAISRTVSEFLNSIENALEKDSNELRKRRIEFARSHSWHSVAERFSTTISEATCRVQEIENGTDGVWR